jgi:hypothetical protein
MPAIFGKSSTSLAILKPLFGDTFTKNPTVCAKGSVYLSVPSTCVQFKPLSDDFAIDDLSPGYRWFDLYANGDVVTKCRV